ncbi:unnamed protein product, partial [Heterosigma akashiwo]
SNQTVVTTKNRFSISKLSIMSSRIYVGNLPMGCRESDIEDIFYKYGKIVAIDLKTPMRPPSFAFVTFEDERDAIDAIKDRDGYEFNGSRIRCEAQRGL